MGIIRRAALLAAVASTAACALIADKADRLLNPSAPAPFLTASEVAYNDGFLIVDLHADTLMFRRSLADSSGDLGQVDLHRLAKGNVGLQVLTMPTRVPVRNDARGCTDGAESDPAPLLAMVSGWSGGAWVSPHQRALTQARALKAIVARGKDPTGREVRQIETIENLKTWLDDRYANGPANKNLLATLLGVEGAHAFSSDLGAEFETLVREYGLRLVAPTHHFTNEYGGSSEGCEKPQIGLTEAGRRLVDRLFDRNMVLDLAHGSSQTLVDGVSIAAARRRPALVSHTGVRAYLEHHPFAGANPAQRAQALHRATPLADIARIAGIGGTVGVIFWEEQIGGASVDNVVGSILRAYCDLAPFEGTTPNGGFHIIRNASEHISIGSDWDGAARNAVNADGIGAITARLRAVGLADHDVANIVGRNSCRVIAQSLSGGSYDYAAATALCSRYGPAHPPESEAKRLQRQAEICKTFEGEKKQ